MLVVKSHNRQVVDSFTLTYTKRHSNPQNPTGGSRWIVHFRLLLVCVLLGTVRVQPTKASRVPPANSPNGQMGGYLNSCHYPKLFSYAEGDPEGV
jgi:hypothetical protein